MGLAFIGMGVWDETDISLKGLEELRKADVIFAEEYTAETKEGTLARLEKLVGKSIHVLGREEVESGKGILAEAEKKRVALLVAGDPMISTTHLSLKLDALKRGIAVRVVHGCSILSAAISAAGLHVYKFGRPVTLPFWSESYRPKSTYDVILENKNRGLHTLLFLDIKEGARMTAAEAIELLKKIEGEERKGVAAPDSRLVVLSRIGSEEERISYGMVRRLEKKNLGKTPFIIIVPGELHFTEEEALAQFKV